MVSIPENAAEITYILATRYDIPAHLIDGQMYDPFASIEGDPFASWDVTRESSEEWIETRDIRLMAFYSDKANYLEMVERMPDWFEYADTTLADRLLIYHVMPGGSSETSQAGHEPAASAQSEKAWEIK